eukprot:3178141-Pyramimonas_sp.AAC.1
MGTQGSDMRTTSDGSAAHWETLVQGAASAPCLRTWTWAHPGSGSRLREEAEVQAEVAEVHRAFKP